VLAQSFDIGYHGYSSRSHQAFGIIIIYSQARETLQYTTNMSIQTSNWACQTSDEEHQRCQRCLTNSSASAPGSRHSDKRRQYSAATVMLPASQLSRNLVICGTVISRTICQHNVTHNHSILIYRQY